MAVELHSLLDEQVIAFFKTNSNEVFSELLNRYNKKVYYQCRRILIIHEDANDAAQNTFIKVWINLAKFKGNSLFSTWLFRISYNESLAILNKNKRALTETNKMEQVLNADIVMDTSLHTLELKLENALNLLPPKQRMVFHYRYYLELPFKQISEIMETSEGGLKANYHHAFEKIKKSLTN